jgi:hypothetical protein
LGRPYGIFGLGVYVREYEKALAKLPLRYPVSL